jgi:LacI family transcriptional regulator
VAEHLVELGHRRIALINGPVSLKPCAERRDSFLSALGTHGIGLSAAHDVEAPEMTIEAGEQAAAKLLRGSARPTALFCTNDLLALGAERAALASGIRVPSDLAIVGYDDIRFAATSLVPLTTVRNPSFELGYESTRLLLDEALNKVDHAHRRLLFEPELIVRASTFDAGAGSNGDTRKPARAARPRRTAQRGSRQKA